MDYFDQLTGINDRLRKHKGQSQDNFMSLASQVSDRNAAPTPQPWAGQMLSQAPGAIGAATTVGKLGSAGAAAFGAGAGATGGAGMLGALGGPVGLGLAAATLIGLAIYGGVQMSRGNQR